MKIYRTKKGQPYIIQANGRARFIKKNRVSHSTKSKGGVKLAKRKRSSKGGSFGGLSGIVGTAAGVGGYILFEAYLEPKIVEMIGGNVTGTMLNVAELAAGAYLARKGGVLGQVGKAAVVINMYQLIKPFVSA